MKTYLAKKEDIQKKWYLVDAKGKILGRLASKIATILMGKHKSIYTPHVDSGDFVIVINADKFSLTGEKLKKKEYFHHTGYPGGLKSVTAQKMLKEKPEFMLKLAVKRMLPKNRLGRSMLKNLKIYAASDHPHAAQQPELLEI
ncbi:MAG TPA: 50S ribosomal protein L13 [Nitrospinota bacterium]|nr:50S ribosomal protein L13 [Nitrospinota bacterium]